MPTDKHLYEVEILVEADSDEDIERLTDQFMRAICPFDPASPEHPEKCPRRWALTTTLLTRKQAAKRESELNE